MKKWSVLLSVLLSLGLLSGCAEETFVENKEMTLTFSYGERTGNYTGDVQDGIPNGIGKFESINGEGMSWTYEGGFVDGLFEGEGKTTWSDGTWQEGDYKAGDWQQNEWGLIATANGRGMIDATTEAMDFLKGHKDLFPAESTDDFNDYLDETIVYKMISKEPSKYGGTIIKLDNLYVSQIMTFQPTVDVDSKSTLMICTDESMNVYEIYLAQELPNVYEGDMLSAVYGVPVCANSYEAVYGGYVNSLVIAPCYVQE